LCFEQKLILEGNVGGSFCFNMPPSLVVYPAIRVPLAQIKSVVPVPTVSIFNGLLMFCGVLSRRATKFARQQKSETPSFCLRAEGLTVTSE